MNPYFFLGFHNYKDNNVTYMYQIYPKAILAWILELALKSCFSKSDKVLKSFLIGIYIFNAIDLKIFLLLEIIISVWFPEGKIYYLMYNQLTWVRNQ